MITAPKNNIEEGKPQPSLLPMDLLIEILEPAYREGLIKYFRESWRIGFKLSDMKDALDRHMTAFYFHGEDYDEETLTKHNIKKHHLGAAIFCILSMYNSLKVNPDELDDRPFKLFENAKEKLNVEKKF